MNFDDLLYRHPSESWGPYGLIALMAETKKCLDPSFRWGDVREDANA